MWLRTEKVNHHAMGMPEITDFGIGAREFGRWMFG